MGISDLSVVRILGPVGNVPASVVDMVMPPPVRQDFDSAFARVLKPVVNVPTPVVDMVMPPHIHVPRWLRLLLDAVARRRCHAPRELPEYNVQVHTVSTSLSRGNPG